MNTNKFDYEEEDIEEVTTIDKLVDWKNIPTVDDLMSDYNEARSSHSTQVTSIDNWLDNLAGKAKHKAPKGRSQVQPKLIRKQAEWRYAALEEPFLSTEALFEISPRTHLDKEAAIQNKIILEKQFTTDIDKVSFINEYVRTCVDEGTVIVKVGWEVQEETVTEDVEVPVYASPEESLMYIKQAVAEGSMTPDEASAIISEGKGIPIGTEIKTVTYTKEVINRPVLEIKDYRNIIIDPSCEGKLSKVQFIIDRFTTDMSTLKKDGRYKNLDLINVADNSPLAEADYPVEESGFTFKDKPRQKLVAYEYWGYWDIDGSGIVKPIVATFVNNVMIRLEENPYPDKSFPFVIVPYLPLKKSLYGEPDGALLEDNQNIIGAITRGVIDILGRSANGQMGIRKDALDLVNLSKFNKGEDFKFNPNVEPDKAFKMLTYPEIPRSALELINLQNNEAESLTGVKAFTGGISGAALGDSVGGIRSALDATAKRELGILRRLSKGLVQIARKIIAMNAVWLSEEEVVRITDEQFITVKRDDLQGNFDLRITVSTAESDNQKASELSFMLQTMGNSMPLDLTKMILSDIARLRKMPKLAYDIINYQPQPDPIQQQIAMLQIEKLKAEVLNETAKGKENEVDVQLKLAKVAVEHAKAKALNSDSDMKDLNYVEQSQGITHERELEKDYIKQNMKNTVAKQ